MILQRLLRRAARLTAADGAAVVSMHQPPPQTVVEGVGCLAWREPPPSWSDDGLLSRCAAERTRVRATRSASSVHTPQRSPGVLTGASHSRSRSSSTLSRVTEQPAISRLVMYGPTSERATPTPAFSSSCATSLYIR